MADSSDNINNFISNAVSGSLIAYAPNFSSDSIDLFKVRVRNQDLFGADVDLETVPTDIGNTIKLRSAFGAMVPRLKEIVLNNSKMVIPLNVMFKPINKFGIASEVVTPPSRPVLSNGFVSYDGIVYDYALTSMKLANSLYLNGKIFKSRFTRYHATGYLMRLKSVFDDHVSRYLPLVLLKDWLISEGIDPLTMELRFDNSGPIPLGHFQNFVSSILAPCTLMSTATIAASEIDFEDILPVSFDINIDTSTPWDVNTILSALSSNKTYSTVLQCSRIINYLYSVFQGPSMPFVILTVDGAVFPRVNESPPYGAGPGSGSSVPISAFLGYCLVMGYGFKDLTSNVTISYAALQSFMNDSSLTDQKVNQALGLYKYGTDNICIDSLYRNDINIQVFKNSYEHSLI